MIWKFCQFCQFSSWFSKQQAEILHPSQSCHSWGSFSVTCSCHTSSSIHSPENKIGFNRMTENLSNISHHTKIYLQEFPATGHHGLLIWKYSRTLLLLNYLLLREIFYHKRKHQSPMLERFDHATATFWRRAQTNTDKHPHLHRMFQRVQHSLF